MAGTGNAAQRAFLQLRAAFDAKLSVAARYLDAVDGYIVAQATVWRHTTNATRQTSHATRHTSHVTHGATIACAGERTKQARVDALVQTMQRYKPSASEAAADFLRRDSSRKVPAQRQGQAAMGSLWLSWGLSWCFK